MLVRAELLMCRRHWALVPQALQVQVQTAYRRDFLGREYLEAVDAAVRVVEQRENTE